MNSENVKIRQEVDLQYSWYILSFLCIYIGSFLIPGVILFIYIGIFFIPNILQVSSIYILFTEFDSLLTLILWPFILIVCYLMHLFLVGLITRGTWRLTERISPIKDGIIPRNIQSKTLKFYHFRSFLIRYGRNSFKKGPFPWLINWFYNFTGSNKIGKNTTIEEQLGGDRSIEIGKNSYIGVNSIFTSQFVDGIFGNVSYFKIKMGDNVTAGGWNCFGPGALIGNNSYLLPSASGGKHYTLKGKGNYYFGQPVKKLFKKYVKNYLNLSDENLRRDFDK